MLTPEQTGAGPVAPGGTPLEDSEFETPAPPLEEDELQLCRSGIRKKTMKIHRI